MPLLGFLRPHPFTHVHCLSSACLIAGLESTCELCERSPVLHTEVLSLALPIRKISVACDEKVLCLPESLDNSVLPGRGGEVVWLAVTQVLYNLRVPSMVVKHLLWVRWVTQSSSWIPGTSKLSLEKTLSWDPVESLPVRNVSPGYVAPSLTRYATTFCCTPSVNIPHIQCERAWRCYFHSFEQVHGFWANFPRIGSAASISFQASLRCMHICVHIDSMQTFKWQCVNLRCGLFPLLLLLDYPENRVASWRALWLMWHAKVLSGVLHLLILK